MDSVNIIRVSFRGKTDAIASAYQYNAGMILELADLELPPAFEVDFANSATGDSITQIGTGSRVPIPDQFFVPGASIHVWIVWVGEDYVVTRRYLRIMVSSRAARTSETPTPVQQSAIDQAIGALNAAVDSAQEAITHYPRVIGGEWMIWDVSAGEYVGTGVAAQGDDGYSPSVDVSTIVGGHRVTVTDASGTETFDVPDGKDGYSPRVSVSSITGGHRVTVTDADGTETFDVPDGKDGYSPSAQVSKSGDTATITITDAQGTTTADVTDGKDGYSPSVAVSSITGGHRVTVTDASGTEAFDVPDGRDGYSPSAQVSKSGDTATITITDAQGTTTAEVTDGYDGYSPSVAVSSITGGHRVVITDKTGAKSFDVMDGTDGTDGATFTPAVSSAGVISWSNDGGKPNPPSVDLVAAVIAALPSAVGVSF